MMEELEGCGTDIFTSYKLNCLGSREAVALERTEPSYKENEADSL
jgi:hypothetical protein